MSNKAKITKIVACLFLVALMVGAVFGAIASAADTEGRTFTGENAAANVNQRLEIAKPLGVVPLTYTATVKMSSASAKGTIFGHWPGSGVNLGLNFEIYQTGPALCYNSSSDANGSTMSVAFTRDSSAIDGNNTFASHIGEWVHVAIVATPTGEDDTYDFDCYINGVKAYNTVEGKKAYLRQSTLNIAQSVNRFAIGTNNKANPEEFGGAIKDIALYASSLTSDEIEALYRTGVSSISKAGLVAHYDMTTVENPYFEEDLSGNGYHAYRSDKFKPNQTDGGKTFTVNDKVTLTKKLDKMPMTIEALFKTTVNGTIFGNNIDSKTACINFEIFNGGSSPALCFPKDDSGTRDSVQFKTPLSGVTGYTKGEYNHVVITITPTANANEYNFDCYVNGVKAYATQTATAILDIAAIQEAHPFTIGSTAVVDNVFSGNIKSVKLYDRALTATEIKYAAQSGATFSGVLANYDLTSAENSGNSQRAMDTSGNGYHAKAIYVGKAFTEADKTTPYYVHKLLTEMPRSYAATIESTASRPGPIFSNYNNASGNNTDFEIFTNGRPAYVYYTLNSDGTTTITSVRFNYDVRNKGKLHLVAVNEIDKEKGTSVYKLYANGVLVDTVSEDGSQGSFGVEIIHDFDMNLSQMGTRKFSIGSDAARCFNGTIYDVAVYSTALTAEEAADLYSNGIDSANDSLIAAYGLNDALNVDTIKDISGNGHDASKIDYAVSEGRTFSLTENALALEKKLEKAPLTISADIYLTSLGTTANTIFGNFYARDYINFEITSGGRAALVINEMPKNKIETKGTAYIHSIIFNEVIPAGKWVNLTVTFDRYSTSADRYKLYIDGVLSTAGYTYGNSHNDVDSKGNKTVAHNFELDMEWMQRAIPFTLGRDASKAFTGRIRNLALYSEALSAEDVAAACKSGADLSRSDMIAYYNLNSEENTDSFVKDETGNGYNFAHEFYVNDSGLTSSDYDYSFAFMGDIQFLTLKDSLEGTNTTAPIFNWLIQNKEAKKLQYVFGLGDVTDKNTAAEWIIASNLFQSLGKAGINYAVTPGNHDGTYDYINYNTYFSADPYLTEGIVYMTENNVNNYYKNFEVNGYKYMVLVLEFGVPTKNVSDKNVIQWANDVVAANSDRQVIVLTHGYIGYDGGFISETELHCPPSGTNYNSGEEIWEKFVSQHENIIISACGHIDPYNIKHRQDVGVNGNVVNQFLIDNQALDKNRNYDTGMIAMFYFSNGGKDVRVEYVSTTKSLREGKEIVFGKENQFNFTLDVPTVTENIKTPYGEIPFVNSNLDLNKVVLFGENKKFLGGFASVEGAMAKLMALDKTADYTILLRDDARKSGAANLNGFTGSLTIDLGGHELKVDEGGNYLIDVFYNDASAIRATYNIKNGTLTKTHGRGLVCMNYGASFSADSITSFDFECVRIRTLNSDLNANTVFVTWENGYSGATANMLVNSTFTDCVFDMAHSVDNAVMLSLNHGTGDRVVHSVTIRGGEVIANSADAFEKAFATFDKKTEGRYDKLAFAANGDGEYTKITLPSGEEAPVVDYTALELVLVSDEGGKATYTFLPANAPIEFVPKASVTLYTDFKLNIYLPKNPLVALTYGTESIDLSKLDVYNFGGVDYYRYSVSLKSFNALDDVTVRVTVTDGANNYNGSFTFSVYNYALTVIEGDFSAVEKALARDMLSYVKAAYIYWNNTSGKLANIDALLGADYNNTADMSKADTATAPSGTGFTGVTFHLGDAPAYRFYYEGAAPSYTFTVGERTVGATFGTDENGKTYLEVKVYAYEILLGVTFGNHSYSVYTYYAWAKANGMNAEMTLVERLVNYCESAEAYRASVVKAN